MKRMEREERKLVEPHQPRWWVFRTPFLSCWQYSRRDNGSISNLRNINYFRSKLFLKELPKECVLGCTIRGPSCFRASWYNIRKWPTRCNCV